MDTSFVITKIELRNVFGINRQTCVELDNYNNLIDGEAMDVMLSIPSAIDLILNPTHGDAYLAMKALNQGVERNDNDAFVTLHITANQEFDMHGKTVKKFTVTRHIEEKLVDFVYVARQTGRRERAKNQTIKSFHAEISRLKFIRINDPIISQRTRPTVYDLNRLCINMLNTKDQVRQMKLMKHFEQKMVDKIAIVEQLVKMEKKQMKVAKPYLIKMHTVQAMILKKLIDELDENYRNAHAGSARRGSNFSSNVEKFKKIYRSLSKSYGSLLRSIIRRATKRSDSPTPSSHSNDLDNYLAVFMDKFEEYKTSVMNNSNAKAHNFEHNARVRMQSHLHRYFGKPADEINQQLANFDTLIAAANRRVESLSTGNLVNNLKALDNKIRADLTNKKEVAKTLIEKLKHMGENALDADIRSFKVKRDLLQSKNELYAKDLGIAHFLDHQSILNALQTISWQNGLLALTSRDSYRRNITDCFAGNIFDFISPNADGHAIESLLPALVPYFATFIFTTPGAVKVFTELVQPFLEGGKVVHLHSIAELNAHEIGDLPYVSLSEFLLDENTQTAKPFAKAWFDQFRVVVRSNVSMSTLQRQAIRHQCKIIFGNMCIQEDGSIVKFFQQNVGSMQNLIEQWQRFKDDRQGKIIEQRKIFEFEKDEAKLEHEAAKSAKGLMETKCKITELLFKIQHGMKVAIKTSDALDTAQCMIAEQQANVKVYGAMQQFLQSGSLQPNIELKQKFESIHTDLIADMTAVMSQFDEFVVKTVDDMTKHFPLLTNETIANYKHNLNALQDELPTVQAFIYDAQIDIANVPEPNNNLVAVDTVGGAVAYEKIALFTELCEIRKFPELLSRDVYMEYYQMNLNDLQQVKKQCLETVPDDLLLPELGADMSFLIEVYELIAPLPDYVLEAKNNFAEITYKLLPCSIYFNMVRVVSADLNSLYRIQPEEDEIISFGMEVLIESDKIYIFPDTEFDPEVFVKYSMESICAPTTGLDFVFKSNQSEYRFKSDVLDVQSHQLSRIFHMIISIKMNSSLIILNNTVIGIPNDELREFIERFQLNNHPNDKFGDLNQSRQVIVLTRRQNPDLFTSGFNRIWCTKRNGQANIVCHQMEGAHSENNDN